MPDLLVTIGADASQYNKTMADAGAAASTASSDITKSLGQAAVATDNLGGSAISASMKFQQMRSGVSAARDGVMAFTVGGQSADRYLMAFGHHLTSLVNETGSFTGALGSLASSLIGPGGVILAISLAVELWQKYSDSQKKVAETQDDYTKALNDTVESSTKELASLTTLYAASQNDLLSRKQRVEAVKELQKEYPDYFKNLSQEAILAGDAATAYDALTQSIINKAVVDAGQENLKDALKPLIQTIADAQSAQAQIDKLNASINNRRALNKPNTPLPTTSLTNTLGFRAVNQNVRSASAITQKFEVTDENGNIISVEEFKKQQTEKIKEASSAVQSLLEQYGLGAIIKKDVPNQKSKVKDAYEELEKSVKDAQEAVNNAIVKGEITGDSFANPLNIRLQSLKKQLADVKAASENLDSGLGYGVKGAGIEGGNAGALKPDSNNADNFTASLDKQNAAFNANSGAISRNIKYWNEFRDAGAAANSEYKEQNKTLTELTKIIGGGLQNAFESALSGTQSFAQAMSQFFVQLIEKMIATIAVAALLALVLSFTGLGEALGASSATFGGEFSQILGSSLGGGGVKLASGGITTGPTHALIGEGNEPEAVMPLSKLQKFVNTGSQNGAISNGQIIGVLSGPNLLLKWQTRAQKQRGRIA